MPAEPVPADPGPDDDLAWLDRDPMTAEEREEWLDRVCELDEPPEPEEYDDFDPLTPDELAGIAGAAAGEPLAVEAATTGRRGPGQPGSARIFPGESSSPAAGFGPGWCWTWSRRAPAWPWPPTPPTSSPTAPTAGPPPAGRTYTTEPTRYPI